MLNIAYNYFGSILLEKIKTRIRLPYIFQNIGVYFKIYGMYVFVANQLNCKVCISSNIWCGTRHTTNSGASTKDSKNPTHKYTHITFNCVVSTMMQERDNAFLTSLYERNQANGAYIAIYMHICCELVYMYIYVHFCIWI